METRYLQTRRMDLRAFTPEDAENLAALDGDPEVMRFLSDGAPTPLNVIRDEVLPRFERASSVHPGLGIWATCDRASGEFMGWFHLRPFENDLRVLELGYRLMRKVWGRGLATEGSLALIDKGFGELGADRIVAKTMRANGASRRVMEKAGLTFDSEFVEERFPGEDKAAVLYSLTREAYASRATRRF